MYDIEGLWIDAGRVPVEASAGAPAERTFPLKPGSR